MFFLQFVRNDQRTTRMAIEPVLRDTQVELISRRQGDAIFVWSREGAAVYR